MEWRAASAAIEQEQISCELSPVTTTETHCKNEHWTPAGLRRSNVTIDAAALPPGGWIEFSCYAQRLIK